MSADASSDTPPTPNGSSADLRVALVDEGAVRGWFDDARDALAEGRISDAHRLFAQVAEAEPTYTHVGHALAITLPNSFVIRVEAQIETGNAVACVEALNELRAQQKDVQLWLLDFGAQAFAGAGLVNVVATLAAWEPTVRFLNLQARVRVVLEALGYGRMAWTRWASPVLGPDHPCEARFAKRRAFSLSLPGRQFPPFPNPDAVRDGNEDDDTLVAEPSPQADSVDASTSAEPSDRDPDAPPVEPSTPAAASPDGPLLPADASQSDDSQPF